MTPLESLATAYADRKGARRRLRAEARVRVERELAAIDTAFARQVKAIRAGGATIAEIARAMKTSPSIVYSWLDR